MSERISEAERAVMEVLWDQSPLTASDIADRVDANKQWSLATVKTLLSRLTQKQAVSYEEDGRRFLYSPVLQRGDHTLSESTRLVDSLFGGRISPLVAHLADNEKLDDADIAELEALIRKLKP